MLGHRRFGSQTFWVSDTFYFSAIYLLNSIWDLASSANLYYQLMANLFLFKRSKKIFCPKMSVVSIVSKRRLTPNSVTRKPLLHRFFGETLVSLSVCARVLTVIHIRSPSCVCVCIKRCRQSFLYHY